MVSSMREIIAGSVFIFVNRWCSALHLLHQKHAVWLYHLFWSCRTWCLWCQQFGKKKPKEERKCSFQPLWQSKRSRFSLGKFWIFSIHRQQQIWIWHSFSLHVFLISVLSYWTGKWHFARASTCTCHLTYSPRKGKKQYPCITFAQ